MIWMITIGATVLEKDQIEEVGRTFQKEIDRRRELDEWNLKYKETYGTIEDKMNGSRFEPTEQYRQIPVETEDEKPVLKSKQLKGQICDETFK